MIVADFKNRQGKWVNSFGTGKNQHRTFSGKIWDNMKSRCKVNGALQKLYPAYVGCTFNEDFLDFHKFAEWHNSQVGYKVGSYTLDKDILHKGNKTYNQNNCIIVPSSLNSFFTKMSGDICELPLGVSLAKCHKKYQAQITISGKVTPLGIFVSKTDAFQAYKIAKQAEAKRWVSRLQNKEFDVDKRVLERLLSLEVHENGIFW